MDAKEAARRDDLFLLDVREHDEWEAGRAEGSHHIPLRELGARQAEIPTDRPILCVCRSGNRSGMVVRALRDAGYDAHNLDGGLQAWQADGFDLVDADGGLGEVI
jgi:rhodanese-related sulfurtransferase